MQNSVTGHETVEIRGRIRTDNISIALSYMADQTGYTLSDQEMEVLAFEALHATSNQPYSYLWEGAQPTCLSLSRSTHSDYVEIAVLTHAAITTNIAMALNVYEHFDASQPLFGLAPVLLETFSTARRPDSLALLACTAEHLSRCSECQEALDTFAEHKWTDALDGEWDPPLYFADIAFLSAGAKLYFLPAYLATALRARKSEFLSSVIRSMQSAPRPLAQAQDAFVQLIMRLFETIGLSS